ncbi:hypothetical protein [Streptomyces sp. NPDC002067]
MPIAPAAPIGTVWMPRDHSPRVAGRIYVADAVLGCGGPMAPVFGCGRAKAAGWTSPSALRALGGGTVLLAGSPGGRHAPRCRCHRC